MAEGYSSKRLEVRVPPKLVSATQIFLRGFILFLVIISAFRILSLYDNILDLDPHIEIVAPVIFIFLAISLILFLYYAITGIKGMIKGFSEMFFPNAPAKIPDDFKSYQEVITGFKERKLNIYDDDPRMKKIRWMFGNNTRYISPSVRKVFLDNGSSLSNKTGLVLLFILLISLVSLTPRIEDIADILPHRISILPFIFSLIILVISAVVEVISGLMMVPKREPGTQALEGTEHYRGFGHPSQIFSRLPDLFIPLAYDGFLNRIFKGGSEVASSVVGDVGNFSGFMIIEQQPRLDSKVKTAYKYFILFSGSIFVLLGTMIHLFAFIPGVLNINNLITLFGYLVLGWVLTGEGNKFLRRAHDLFNIINYISQAALVELEGNLYRSDIRVGKSIQDSIESSNVAVRSDFTARFWSATIESEAAKITEKRDILALVPNKESHGWIQYTKEALGNLREEGIKPLGIDIKSEEVKNVVHANLQILAIKSEFPERNSDEFLMEPKNPKLIAEKHIDPPMDLPGSEETQRNGSSSDLSGVLDVPEGYKECPMCAEFVRIRAAVCRYCGHEF